MLSSDMLLCPIKITLYWAIYSQNCMKCLKETGIKKCVPLTKAPLCCRMEVFFPFFFVSSDTNYLVGGVTVINFQRNSQELKKQK